MFCTVIGSFSNVHFENVVPFGFACTETTVMWNSDLPTTYVKIKQTESLPRCGASFTFRRQINRKC